MMIIDDVACLHSVELKYLKMLVLTDTLWSQVQAPKQILDNQNSLDHLPKTQKSLSKSKNKMRNDFSLQGNVRKVRLNIFGIS